jgi:hypothetical protein
VSPLLLLVKVSRVKKARRDLILNKKIGLGSISLLLFLFGILFSVSFGNRAAYGDSILKLLGLNPWSKGDTGLHLTLFYSLVFYIPASFLGYKFRNDWGAVVGGFLSFVMIVIFLVVIPLAALPNGLFN